MKIALIIKTFSLRKGGAERYAVRLAEALRREDHEVHIFADQWDDSVESGLIFHRVQAGRGPAFLKLLRFHRGCRRELQGAHFDVVHALAQAYPADVYRMSDGLFRHWLSLQYPNRLHRFLRCLLRPVYFFNLAAERKILKEGGGRWLIANSELCRRQAIDTYSVSPDRIERVYNSVDLKSFHPGVKKFRSQIRKEHGIDPDAPLLLFSAMNFSRKGLAELIQSLSVVSASFPDVRVMVIGKGDPGPYRKLARALRIEERLIFAGAVKEPAPYYGAADLFVLPTHYDPFANVCLEAMACGLPVVTTRENGAAELIQEGVNGFVVESAREIGSLSEAIRRALLHPKDEMGRSAAETAAGFSQADHLKKVAQVYERAAAGKIDLERRSRRPEMWVNRSFSSILKKNDLLSYEQIMKNDGGTLLKRIQIRTVAKLELSGKEGGRSFYLKKHRYSLSPVSIVKRFFSSQFGIASSDAAQEWNRILGFHQIGLPTMMPVAVGVGGSPFREESFLMTEGLEGYEPLETWIPLTFRVNPSKEQVQMKRALIREIALLTRRMHLAGFYHRDYYLTHLLVKRISDRFDLKVIDLQRVIRAPWLRRRWQTKDLAALSYSSPSLTITRCDRLRFYKAYQNISKLGEADLSLIRQVERKTALIGRHTVKMYQKREKRKRLGLLER
jgi:UDP-glucose:(heptosyl)LPS alpha-1,3-glucosyltransferase